MLPSCSDHYNLVFSNALCEDYTRVKGQQGPSWGRQHLQSLRIQSLLARADWRTSRAQMELLTASVNLT